jgi:hypothetical protein
MSSDNELGAAVAGGVVIGGVSAAILVFTMMAIDPITVLPEPTGKVVECRASEWAPCIAAACPNGIVVNGPKVVSCKAAPSPCDGGSK